MTEKNQDLSLLVSTEDQSQLKKDLNRGVASLLTAPKSYLRPHYCLNRDAVKLGIIEKIAENPEMASSRFWMTDQSILDPQSGLWINTVFGVSLEGLNRSIVLTPRQTGYVVFNLPDDSRASVLEKVRAWYLGSYLEKVQEHLSELTAQIERGNMLVPDARENHVFDIQRGIGKGEPYADMGVPYTEWRIIGMEMFAEFCLTAATAPQRDGYEMIDKMLLERRRG